ncbi:DUF368 domain-containing protein [Demequina activiva]|uniref:DUF368 domain-containing protein n=1 Tax=Demequina activiva TaxID=1582364 RepID=A0A919Q3W9_9MICO|nr:DUF368 domain-containing protein [Demequina activiva]GIG55351.1 DUF368 domain-containing protein [Demequina activiva]
MSAHTGPGSGLPPQRGPRHFILNVARGGVIGAVEIVPGVSGGTMALVLGVYDTLIDSAGSLVRGAVAWARRDRDLAREHMSHVRWRVLLPLGIGMLTAIVLVAAAIAPFLEDHPEEMRALFAGLIVASLAVPIGMVERWRAPQYAIAAVAAVAAFLLTGLTGTERSDPSLLMVAGAASVAVCALVLPGVSGSFLLVVLGMYAPTIAAVNDRDLVYLGAFSIGAIIGLSAFVTGLQWLLAHRRSLTLAAMTGLMVGSLRALWPWQDEDGALEAPSGDVGVAVGLFLLGIAVVVALLALERRAKRRAAVQLEAAGR